MRNLMYRIITSLILLPIVIMAFVVKGLFLTSLLAIVCLVCCFEVANMVLPHNRRARILSLLCGAAIFLPFVVPHKANVALLSLFLMFVLFNAVVLFVTNIGREEVEKLSTIFYWCAYVTFAILSVYWLIVDPADFDERVGVSFVLLGCLATWGNDTLAYFGGRLFGKRPLFLAVSAKKTWEGFFCGGIGSVIAVLCLAYGASSFGFEIFWGLALHDLLWILLPATVFAPMGDLIESRLKRLYDTKDSSNILPGHGGVLDRIDGLLVTLPWTCVYAFIIRPIW